MPIDGIVEINEDHPNESKHSLWGVGHHHFCLVETQGRQRSRKAHGERGHLKCALMESTGLGKLTRTGHPM